MYEYIHIYIYMHWGKCNCWLLPPGKSLGPEGPTRGKNYSTAANRVFLCRDMRVGRGQIVGGKK